ncbi:2,3-dihydroxybenzoate-AMP ligase [Thermocatellispora tengchongensis]|uniref:2,3-dihydroxybenzoate-AMP ligase n=1 Tax=Thermocatellispora tengchongensis TaxID=1073253 RepID=A0A840PCD5_9ACTN|nr:AMP-binding protein [Thermocatellispora tengchongensis]MBB5139084.1 2,3-dihydroxybenzoate-AMP ligase [Thermocatellispora tengchongensis]
METLTGPLAGFTPWPDDLAERYIAEGYWGDTVLGDVLRGGDPRATALVAGDERLTYAELDRRADRAAAGFLRLGVRGGDRVVVQLPNTVAFAVVFLALVRIGAAPVLALPAHRRSEISYLCELAEAVAYVVPDVHGGFDYRELAREVVAATGVPHVVVDGDAAEFTPLASLDAEPVPYERPDPASVGVFLLSGGTTGLPKLIPRTHRDYVYNVEASADVCGFTDRTVYLVVLPVAHNFALACPGVLGVWARGGTVVLAPSGSPDEAFPLIERERVTACAVVPPIALLWLDAASWSGEDLSSLELLQVGGAKLAAERAAQVPGTLGCKLQQVFGMAEGLLNYTRLDDPAELVEISQGRPLSPADEIRVVDSEGRDVPPGEVGELLTRGPYTLRGYYRAPEHNARSFTPDGFYRTGDLVRVLPSGHLVVEGREKDQINRGGDKVSAEELEGHLLAHPAVHDAAVVGVPDPVMGERTCAFLIVRGEAPTLREIKEFLKERGVAAYKFPDRIEVTDAFPRTPVGKVSKRTLLARLG